MSILLKQSTLRKIRPPLCGSLPRSGALVPLGGNERGKAKEKGVNVALTHIQPGEYFVLPGQIIDTVLLRQRLHDVEEGDESRRLHGKPSYASWQIEIPCCRSLPHAVPLGEPLDRADLLWCLTLVRAKYSFEVNDFNAYGWK